MRKKSLFESRILRVICTIACLALFASCGDGDDGGDEASSEVSQAPPTVTTLATDMVDETTETVTGSINPNSKETEYWFEWEIDESLSNASQTAIQILGASLSESVVSSQMTGLTPGTLYYYRLCARNADGTAEGEVNACYHYANVVFVTSARATGNLGSWMEASGKTGIEAGDAICQKLADDAGLQGEFMAWLSDSSIAAEDRLARSAESYLRVDGVRVAENWSDLTTPPYLENPISINERGLSNAQLLVFTGTRVDGTAALWGNTCDDWGSDDQAHETTVGSSGHPDFSWTEQGVGPCGSPFSLYCFQQNFDLPQEDFNTGCPGPIGWAWHVSRCSKGLYQDPDCAYICCNFYNGTHDCNDPFPDTVGGYTVTSCDYNMGLYTLSVISPAGEDFIVTCEVE